MVFSISSVANRPGRAGRRGVGVRCDQGSQGGRFDQGGRVSPLPARIVAKRTQSFSRPSPNLFPVSVIPSRAPRYRPSRSVEAVALWIDSRSVRGCSPRRQCVRGHGLCLYFQRSFRADDPPGPFGAVPVFIEPQQHAHDCTKRRRCEIVCGARRHRVGTHSYYSGLRR